MKSGKEYPVYARRKGSLTAPEEVMLDGNAMAAGTSFFQVGDTAVSPNGKLLAYAVDEVGRRQYTLKIKNLETGETLPDTVADVEPNLVWANDNKTVLYVEKDPVTLLSVRVHRHPLGGDAKLDPLVYEEKDHTYYMGIAPQQVTIVTCSSSCRARCRPRCATPRPAIRSWHSSPCCRVKPIWNIRPRTSAKTS